MSNDISFMDEQGWNVAYVRYQSERKVATFLRTHYAFQVSVPFRKLFKVRGKKRITFERPLIEMYVFFRAGLQKINWNELYRTEGLISIVRLNGEPASVPHNQVSTLEKLCCSEAPLHEVEYKKLEHDDMVEVTEGPLKGAIGQYKGCDADSGQLVVTIDLFQRSMETLIDSHLVKRI